ncbi:MAG: CRISPR-associated endonuclease Cas2 [Candidatus Portnoybacteria bacterium]|nr:CRISPR-associated endonuclease Cas2 [Candidatus Portnoybacteria bacterium]
MSDLNTNKKKILLILMGGAALCLNRSPERQFHIVKAIGKGWKQIKEDRIKQDIRELYRSKLVNIKTDRDGVISMVLADNGKTKALKYQLEDMRIKKQAWDRKWRIVIFDIPEEQKMARDAFRFRLKKIGFHELQKSVFVHPFECEDEINFIAEFYQIKPHILYGVIEKIDNDLYLKNIFDL